MKKVRFLMVFGICIIVCLLFTTGSFGELLSSTPLPELSLDPLLKSTPNPIPEGIPTVTLPISNLLEVRKDLIRKEGNASPGGWSEYYIDYKRKTAQEFLDEEARPFDSVAVIPITLEMLWVDILVLQDQNFESDEWAEKEFSEEKQFALSYNVLAFQIFLRSESLNLLAKDDLRFVYQDSTGTRKDGMIILYEMDETKKPIYKVSTGAGVSLHSNLQNITWFSLHILNKKTAGRVDMCWDFKKD